MPALSNVIKLSKKILHDPVHDRVHQKTLEAKQKIPKRHDVINFLLSKRNNNEKLYLEIGVRNPLDNFDKIIATQKYSVDPGVEFEENPVDFKLTSDDFFEQLRQNKILNSEIKFDIIFIDGLHISGQAYRDVYNSLEFLKDDGFLVLHDCNPATEYHAREDRTYKLSPARGYWNGTVWKAFYKCRLDSSLSCCCVDCDWGIGVISKKKFCPHLGHDINPFFEFAVFDEYRKESLNLVEFETFRQIIELV